MLGAVAVGVHALAPVEVGPEELRSADGARKPFRRGAELRAHGRWIDARIDEVRPSILGPNTRATSGTSTRRLPNIPWGGMLGGVTPPGEVAAGKSR